jgi:hypothetical protein
MYDCTLFSNLPCNIVSVAVSDKGLRIARCLGLIMILSIFLAQVALYLQSRLANHEHSAAS